MRLIDADKQFSEKASDGTEYVLAYAGNIYTVSDECGRVVCEFIPEQPTVDAAPVVHGRWEVVMHKQDIAYYAQCDHCGFEYACGSKGLGSLIDELEPFFYNYCPNCGALMDGGEEE